MQGEPIDLVDVFRRPEHTPAVARDAVGLGPRNWLGDTGLVIPSIAMLEVWRGVGYWTLLFLAALLIGQLARQHTSRHPYDDRGRILAAAVAAYRAHPQVAAVFTAEEMRRTALPTAARR